MMIYCDCDMCCSEGRFKFCSQVWVSEGWAQDVGSKDDAVQVLYSLKFHIIWPVSINKLQKWSECFETTRMMIAVTIQKLRSASFCMKTFWNYAALRAHSGLHRTDSWCKESIKQLLQLCWTFPLNSNIADAHRPHWAFAARHGEAKRTTRDSHQ